MTAARRWALVALGVALLVAVPLAWRAVPVPTDDTDAATVLERVRASGQRSWSGFVETDGQVQFPSVDEFDDVAALLGDRSRLRVWWRDEDAWRVDRLLTAGESSLVHADGATTAWSFERARAEIAVEDPAIRLPRTVDLLPSVLAERSLRGAGPGDVERLPARRVAGRAASGLRVRPSSGRSAVDRVDLWADRQTGVPLRVEVHADPGDFAELTTTVRDFVPGEPGDEVLDFTPTPGTEVVRDDVLDIADAANQYAPLRPPARVAGLPRTSASDGAVGVYGAGLTQLVAIPLRSQEADALRDQVGVTPGSERVVDPPGLTVALAPLGLLVTGTEGDGAWLVAGTVTRATLEAAGRDLLRDTLVLEDGR